MQILIYRLRSHILLYLILMNLLISLILKSLYNLGTHLIALGLKSLIPNKQHSLKTLVNLVLYPLLYHFSQNLSLYYYLGLLPLYQTLKLNLNPLNHKASPAITTPRLHMQLSIYAISVYRSKQHFSLRYHALRLSKLLTLQITRSSRLKTIVLPLKSNSEQLSSTLLRRQSLKTSYLPHYLTSICLLNVYYTSFPSFMLKRRPFARRIRRLDIADKF